MHYLPARQFPTEAFNRAVAQDHANGRTVAVGTGFGFAVIPPGYRVAEITRQQIVLRGPGAEIVRPLRHF